MRSPFNPILLMRRPRSRDGEGPFPTHTVGCPKWRWSLGGRRIPGVKPEVRQRGLQTPAPRRGAQKSTDGFRPQAQEKAGRPASGPSRLGLSRQGCTDPASGGMELRSAGRGAAALSHLRVDGVGTGSLRYRLCRCLTSLPRAAVNVSVGRVRWR